MITRSRIVAAHSEYIQRQLRACPCTVWHDPENFPFPEIFGPPRACLSIIMNAYQSNMHTRQNNSTIRLLWMILLWQREFSGNCTYASRGGGRLKLEFPVAIYYLAIRDIIITDKWGYIWSAIYYKSYIKHVRLRLLASVHCHVTLCSVRWSNAYVTLSMVSMEP